jgi:hypothetical protein
MLPFGGFVASISIGIGLDGWLTEGPRATVERIAQTRGDLRRPTWSASASSPAPTKTAFWRWLTDHRPVLEPAFDSLRKVGLPEE